MDYHLTAVWKVEGSAKGAHGFDRYIVARNAEEALDKARTMGATAIDNIGKVCDVHEPGAACSQCQGRKSMIAARRVDAPHKIESYTALCAECVTADNIDEVMEDY